MKNIATKLLCLTLALTLLTACGAKPAEVPATEATAASTEPVVTEPAAAETLPKETIQVIETEDLTIVTSYGNLLFPGDWAPLLHTEVTDGDPCTVAFSAVLDSREAPQPLYTITLGGEAEGAVGAIQTADGTWYAVKVEIPTFTPDDTWSEQDINIVFTMQETINAVLSSLDIQDPDVLNEDVKETEPKPTQSSGKVDPDDLKMDTPYMELHYPAKWMDCVLIQVEEGDSYSVTYSAVIGTHPQQHLFTVHFGGSQGTSLKTIKAESGEMVEIRIELTELELDGTWSAEERSTVTSMQEDLNYLLSKMN